MNLRDGELLHLPFASTAEGALHEARRLMVLAAAASQDEEHDNYERQALLLYQEAWAMDRGAADSTAYADLQHMWVDLMSVPPA